VVLVVVKIKVVVVELEDLEKHVEMHQIIQHLLLYHQQPYLFQHKVIQLQLEEEELVQRAKEQGVVMEVPVLFQLLHQQVVAVELQKEWVFQVLKMVTLEVQAVAEVVKVLQDLGEMETLLQSVLLKELMAVLIIQVLLHMVEVVAVVPLL
jgi:hypothetical protein